MAKSPNRLLASLPADALSAISPHLKIVELKFGDVLAEAGSPIRQVYFPYSGAISLVVDLDVGMMIETAMVGRDGVLNAAEPFRYRPFVLKGGTSGRGTLIFPLTCSSSIVMKAFPFKSLSAAMSAFKSSALRTSSRGCGAVPLSMPC